ncbi:MAG: hypothetical protein H0W88_00140 [Parachlamydiaceae bacterium]|nr:hypothetical protein [Parachlamydiaceae bacterium]
MSNVLHSLININQNILNQDQHKSVLYWSQKAFISYTGFLSSKEIASVAQTCSDLRLRLVYEERIWERIANSELKILKTVDNYSWRECDIIMNNRIKGVFESTILEVNRNDINNWFVNEEGIIHFCGKDDAEIRNKANPKEIFKYSIPEAYKEFDFFSFDGKRAILINRISINVPGKFGFHIIFLDINKKLIKDFTITNLNEFSFSDNYHDYLKFLENHLILDSSLVTSIYAYKNIIVYGRDPTFTCKNIIVYGRDPTFTCNNVITFNYSERYPNKIFFETYIRFHDLDLISNKVEVVDGSFAFPLFRLNEWGYYLQIHILLVIRKLFLRMARSHILSG